MVVSRLRNSAHDSERSAFRVARNPDAASTLAATANACESFIGKVVALFIEKSRRVTPAAVAFGGTVIENDRALTSARVSG